MSEAGGGDSVGRAAPSSDECILLLLEEVLRTVFCVDRTQSTAEQIMR